nr:cisplatin damage response ATP-dependent DNA ligase [Lautropia sp.]
MKAFAKLYIELDETTSSNAKLAAMAGYFRSAPAADAAWAVYFLAGGKPRQLVPVKVLRDFAQQASGMPPWLVEECYQSVGDMAETIALLVPPAGADMLAVDAGLSQWMEERLLPLRGMVPAAVLERLGLYWAELDSHGRFVCGKLITGNFRVGVSRLLVTRALAAASGIDGKRIAQRLVGYTDIGHHPRAEDFLRLVAAESGTEGDTRSSIHPYPFFLAQPLQLPTGSFGAQLGPPQDWLVEWKWDGIRAQVVRRTGEIGVWSRGEELVTDRFPEVAAMARLLPDGTVLDGEIVAWTDGTVQAFARLQQRLGRKTLSPRLLEDIPVCLLAYDLLEWQGQDWRTRAQSERRTQLERLVADLRPGSPALQLSPLLAGADWEELDLHRQESRARGVEGMMLKAKTSLYGVGRTSSTGVWWKWKVDPFSVDAVLI